MAAVNIQFMQMYLTGGGGGVVGVVDLQVVIDILLLGSTNRTHTIKGLQDQARISGN